MKSEFLIDTEDLSAEVKTALERALFGLAESDLPLLAEFVLADETQIRTLNRERRGIDRVTDVLSFPAAEFVPGEEIFSDEHGECVEETEDGAEALLIGSVVVCRKRAEEQAEAYGHSYARELSFLAVHGVLHCLGYDHETEEERARMRAKEEEVLQKMGLKREE